MLSIGVHPPFSLVAVECGGEEKKCVVAQVDFEDPDASNDFSGIGIEATVTVAHGVAGDRMIRCRLMTMSPRS